MYFISIELDKYLKITHFEKMNIVPAVLGINVFFLISIFLNRNKRYEIQEFLRSKNKDTDLESGSSLTGMLSSTGLTTLFNALTQTTTTLCANG
jgi:hypothetical protein